MRCTPLQLLIAYKSFICGTAVRINQYKKKRSVVTETINKIAKMITEINRLLVM